MSGLCLEKYGALKHQIETPLWVLNDFSCSNFLEPWQRRNWLSNMHLNNLFLYDRNNLYGYDAQISFKRILYKEIKWWGPPPAGALPDCRIHTGNNLLGILPAKGRSWHADRNITILLWYTTLTGEFEKVLANQWGAPVSIAVQGASSYPILLFRCQVCIAFRSLSSPAPALIFLLPLQLFFPKWFHQMPASWRIQTHKLPLTLWMLTLTYLFRWFLTL